MNHKIFMISLGCEKNKVDAEIMLFKIKEAGYEIVLKPELADAVIINTCGFIEAAKEEAIEEIFNIVRLKQQGKVKYILVSGCLAERYKDEILKEIPEVDAVLGIGSNSFILEILSQVFKNKKVESFGEKICLPLSGKRIRSTPKHYAYLKIAEGCNNKCTFCAIPIIRGQYRSRKMEDIILEARDMAKSGVKELILIAQDTTRYGEDIYDKLMLPELLKELLKIDEIKWIRILYCYPDRITDELIDLIAREDRILNYIDLPLQHCNGKILKSMNRSGNKDTLLKLLNKIKTRIPDVVLRSTFIVGFPGETEDDFNELCEYLDEVKFDRVGSFTYSPEEGTKAFDFKDQIDDFVKNKRQDILMRQQNLINDKKNKSKIGQVIEVIIDGFDENTESFFGRSRADAPDVDGRVYIYDKSKSFNIGDIIKVKVKDFIDYDLVGEVL